MNLETPGDGLHSTPSWDSPADSENFFPSRRTLSALAKPQLPPWTALGGWFFQRAPGTARTVPTTRNGGSYETIYYGAMSQVVYRRTTTQCYGDAI